VQLREMELSAAQRALDQMIQLADKGHAPSTEITRLEVEVARARFNFERARLGLERAQLPLPAIVEPEAAPAVTPESTPKPAATPNPAIPPNRPTGK